MVTETRTAITAAKRKLQFRSIQSCARKFHRSLIKQNPELIEYKTLQGKRLRAAIQQLMELADGEKPWVAALKTDYKSWQASGKTVFKIPVGFNFTRGGSPGHRGDMFCYGLRVDYLPNDQKTIVTSDTAVRSKWPIGD